MRLDHIAYRVSNRVKAAQFFIDAFEYKIQTEFDIKFEDGSQCKCIALEPPEKITECDWDVSANTGYSWEPFVDYHLAPEIFISDGDPDSIVGKWVAQNGSGIHHLAYQVDDVQATMEEWKSKGYAEFASEKPLECPDLIQVFTKPSELTGVIYEFINRGKHGFCKENVEKLILSTGEK